MSMERPPAENVRVEEWARASRVMEEDRQAGIRGVVTAQALRNFTGAVVAQLRHKPASSTSGLVEQQRWFRKLR